MMSTEKRLIDANALKSKLQEHHDYFVDGWGGFDKMSFATKCRVDEIDNCIAEIVNATTVDAVEVVRCKDCKHAGINENHQNKPLICYLTRMCGTVKPDWYCWQGERKDND